MPKTQIKVGSYAVSRESKHVKIAHDNKAFILHMGATDADAHRFFEQIKDPEVKKYFEVTFASMVVFNTLAIQNPEYMQAWLDFHNSYFDGLKKELTLEEDKQIIDEEKALYEMGKEETKTNKDEQ